MIYVIRVREKNIIKTLKVNDKETLNYIIEKLEEENKEYVVLKYKTTTTYFSMNSLLDFDIKECVK